MTTPATKASVLLVDDHALLRTGVANIINQESDLHVVAEAGNGVEALAAWDRHHPDVTLLDLRMPVMEGVEVVQRLRERDPRARVIVLTTYDTDEEISRALGITPKIQWAPMQPGDVQQTSADLTKSGAMLGYAPRTPFPEGIRRFVAWFRESHGRPD